MTDRMTQENMEEDIACPEDRVAELEAQLTETEQYLAMAKERQIAKERQKGKAMSDKIRLP